MRIGSGTLFCLFALAVPAAASAAPSLVPATVGASVAYAEQIDVTTPKGPKHISGTVRLTRSSENSATIALTTTSGQSATIPATVDNGKLSPDRGAVDPSDDSKKEAYALFAPFGQLAGIMKAHSGEDTSWTASLPSDPANPSAGTMSVSANVGLRAGSIAVSATGGGPGRITLPSNPGQAEMKGAAGGAMMGGAITGHPGLGAALGARRAKKKSEGVQESVPTTNDLRLSATIAKQKLNTITSTLTQRFAANGRNVSVTTNWNVTAQ